MKFDNKVEWLLALLAVVVVGGLGYVVFHLVGIW